MAPVFVKLDQLESRQRPSRRRSLCARQTHCIGNATRIWPERAIQSEIALGGPVICDGARIAQLFSNLLANALTHGAPDRPVRVRARSDDSCFEISVMNSGEPIPPDSLDRLFEPFSRASARSGQQGLGLASRADRVPGLDRREPSAPLEIHRPA
jgi:signal transduction histidine kinase